MPSTSAPGNWHDGYQETLDDFREALRREGEEDLHCRGQRVYAPIKNPVPSRFHQNQTPRQSRAILQLKAESQFPANAAHAGEHAITGMEHKPASHARCPIPLFTSFLLPAIWTGRLSSPRPHPAEHGLQQLPSNA
ncbi:MAG: hypothetical protein ACLT8E_09435 [Akkermansia sp.]